MNNMDDFWVLSTNVYGYPMVIHVIHIILENTMVIRHGYGYGYPMVSLR